MDRLFRSEIPLASSERLHRTHFRWHLLPTSGVLPKVIVRQKLTSVRGSAQPALITAPIL